MALKDIMEKVAFGKATHCRWPLCGKNNNGGDYCEEHWERVKRSFIAPPKPESRPAAKDVSYSGSSREDQVSEDCTVFNKRFSITCNRCGREVELKAETDGEFVLAHSVSCACGEGCIILGADG